MKILVAGDFCPQHRVVELFDKSDYASVLGEVQVVIQEADYSIVNLECPITKGGERPIMKCGPNLHSSDRGIEALRWAGFNCVTLANNHFYDYSEEGVRNTLTACEKYGLDVVGGGINLSEAARMMYKRIGEETMAVINCCEHEFSIATETTGGSNPLNPIQQYYAIKEAKQHADYVLVIVHGGHEYYQLPSPRMQEIYRFFIDVGADAVVNHHQHCYSGYEIYQGKPIIYGLGNFCFDRKDNIGKKWNEGFLVCLSFDKETTMELFPYVQCAEIPSVSMMNEDKRQTFERNLWDLNHVIANSDMLADRFSDFCVSRYNDMRITMMPYSNRYLWALCNRNIIPSFVTKSRRLLLYNYVACEAHKDVILDYLNS